MKDLMIDIETLGTHSDAAILSIGAAMFDRHTGEIGDTFHRRCKPDLERRSMTFDTFRFWMEQGDEARLGLFDDEAPSLAWILGDLHAFWKHNCDDETTVWAMPPSFDLVILEDALQQEEFECLWPHWQTRCMRTLCDIAGIAKEDRVKAEVAHDALADAIAQAKTAALAFQRIKALA